jgi:hypothetical protein
MSNQDNTPENKAFFDLADQFINLANELARNTGTTEVGTAMRYAAARYNTFEASLANYDLRQDKDKLATLFADDFRNMLLANIDDYARRLENK